MSVPPADPPRWMRDFLRLAQTKTLIFLHGNVNDYVYAPAVQAPQAGTASTHATAPVQDDAQGTAPAQDDAEALVGEGDPAAVTAERWALRRLRQAVVELVQRRVGGYELLATYDPVDGMSFIVDENGRESGDGSPCELFQRLKEPEGGSGNGDGSAQGMRSTSRLGLVFEDMRACFSQTKHACAFVLEHVPQVTAGAAGLDPEERLAFVRLLKAVCESWPARASIDGKPGVRQHLVVLICNKLTDVPAWLYLDNPFVGSIDVGQPKGPEREQFFAQNLLAALPPEVRRRAFVDLKELVDLTDGMCVRDLVGIRQIAAQAASALVGDGAEAASAGVPAEQAERLAEEERRGVPRDAKALVDRYKYGERESEWDHLKWERLDDAEAVLAKRVMGQPAAVAAVADVLRRARLHLSGVEKSGRGKPRGILFFAGPTGTGKTEMAKAIAELIFGSEDTCLRFDMSEYGAQHSDQRLLGAPPGYVGYEEGGQLTNRVKADPFSVLLFDEIEKAHPSILDKFLQILEDGRMTDGRGETVHFSESILVFTSNAGIYELDQQTMRPALDPVTRQARLLVDPAKHTTYESVRDAVLDGVTGFFRTQLGRPELLNRIGHNIVVFDFIREPVMRRILVGKVLPSVAQNVFERWRIEVEFSEQVERDLLTWGGSDVANGGRGIGNLTERALVNPLARVLYRATSEASRKAGLGTRYPLAGATLRVKRILPPGSSEDQRYDIEWELAQGD